MMFVIEFPSCSYCFGVYAFLPDIFIVPELFILGGRHRLQVSVDSVFKGIKMHRQTLDEKFFMASTSGTLKPIR